MFAYWSERWLAGQAHLKPSTRERYAGILREHVLPRWAPVKLANVSHAEVQSWVTTLSTQRSPETVRKIHRVLSLVLALAVKDGRLTRNPAKGVNLPRVVQGEHRYLTHQQVELLADACAAPAQVSKYRRHSERRNDTYRLMVLFLAYTGVRFGELAALRVGRLDFLRRRAVIAESVTLVRAVQVYGTPKGHARREVPIPGFLLEELAVHVEGRGRDDLVFAGARGGGAIRGPVFRRAAFDRAAASIGLEGLHPHELRHYADGRVMPVMLIRLSPLGNRCTTAMVPAAESVERRRRARSPRLTNFLIPANVPTDVTPLSALAEQTG